MNVDASQTQITSVGTIGTGTWQASKIQDNYIQSAATWNAKVGTGGTGLTKSGTTLNVDASQTQITQVGTINSGTWQASAIQDDYIASQGTWHGKIDSAGNGLTKSGTTLSMKSCNNNQILKWNSGTWNCATDNNRRRLDGVETGKEETSDIRLKVNIEAFPVNISASEILSKVAIFSYNSVMEGDDGKDTHDDKRIWGFSAQDLASKTENIVSEGGAEKFTEPWTYNAKSLDAFLLQAIKELKLENKELKSEIKDLKQRRRLNPDDAGKAHNSPKESVDKRIIQ